MRRKISFGLLLIACLVVIQAARSDTKPGRFAEHDEELTGFIFMVEPMENLLIVEKNSVPYSFKITTETRITVGMRNWPANLQDLEARKGHWVTVKFRVTGDGNMAKEIGVGRDPGMFMPMHPNMSPGFRPWRCSMAGGPS
jgi:hypothetical protein